MKDFAKSILNYFAAYTETRFRFDKKIDYFWTDDELTCDLSIFPGFQKEVLQHIQNRNPFSIDIKKEQYKIELSEDKFKKSLKEILNDSYHLGYLKNCVAQTVNNYKKQHGDGVILINDSAQPPKKEKNENTKTLNTLKQEQENYKKLFLEGIRKYNNSFADGVMNLLTKLQEEKLRKLKSELRIIQIPKSTFNPHQIRQQVFEDLQKKALSLNNETEEQYFKIILQSIQDMSFNLIIYDLYASLRQFKTFISKGNLYLFFHEIFKNDLNEEKNNHQNRNSNQTLSISKYPLFLVEVNFEEKEEDLNIRSVRDIMMINTPAINILEPQNMITTPRATRFIESATYLNQVEKHIQDIYSFYRPFLFVQNYPVFIKDNYPQISFRMGLQIVEKENRKLLDYSELITQIDAGKGQKFTSMLKDYVFGNVENTTDEVGVKYQGRYPRKSVNNIISTIPLSLNSTQKRILTAIENKKNKVVVVDGPPGTGKSYTISALTYWANQKNKSVLITSHKKAALDVIDNMMTEHFKRLHPESKPSIIRFSRDESSINLPDKTLATQYISSATERSYNYEEESEAITKDIKNYSEEIKIQNDSFWKSSDEYESYISNLFEFESIKNELFSKAVINEKGLPLKLQLGEEIDLAEINNFAKKINMVNIKAISLSEVIEIYKLKDKIPEWLSVCQNISDLKIKEDTIDKMDDCQPDDLNSFQKLFLEIRKPLKNYSPLFQEKEKLKYTNFYIQCKHKNNESFHQKINKLNHLEFEKIVQNICILSTKDKSDLSVEDVDRGIAHLYDIIQYKKNKTIINPILEITNKSVTEIKWIFESLRKLQHLFEHIDEKSIQSILLLQKYFSGILQRINIDFQDIKTIPNLFLETDELVPKIYKYIKYFLELNKIQINTPPDTKLLREYNQALYKELLSKNDERIKNLNNYATDIERIKTSLKYNKRLSLKEVEILLKNISCIISEPELISQYFPMEEDLIDLLIIDEASQVSIADSISLILRAKQVVVFGDEYQYGAVAAINVNASYSGQYFSEILTSYSHDFNVPINDREKEEITKDIAKDEDPEEQEIQPVYKPEEGKKEWLKTFSIRTSTLNFAKALANYNTSLNIHFRSFPEIIEYSNEFFYRPNQIPLIVNRIRTKPISEVLRFILVHWYKPRGFLVETRILMKLKLLRMIL